MHRRELSSICHFLPLNWWLNLPVCFKPHVVMCCVGSYNSDRLVVLSLTFILRLKPRESLSLNFSCSLIAFFFYHLSSLHARHFTDKVPTAMHWLSYTPSPLPRHVLGWVWSLWVSPTGAASSCLHASSSWNDSVQAIRLRFKREGFWIYPIIFPPGCLLLSVFILKAKFARGWGVSVVEMMRERSVLVQRTLSSLFPR